MGLELKLTTMILFVNIGLLFFFPVTVLDGNDLYEKNGIFKVNDAGDTSINSDFEDSVKELDNQESGLVDSLLGGFIDTIKVIGSFISLLIRMFCAVFWIMPILPPMMQLVIGLPVILAYGFAIVGWFK